MPMVDKVGRNQSCPCGSGKKYKKCHGSWTASSNATSPFPPFSDKTLQQKLREMEAIRVQREKQQGLGRGIVSCEFAGFRMVAVGNKLHWSKQWLTFRDFIKDYFLSVLGKDWCKAEYEKPDAERHPIIRWYAQAIEQSRRLGKVVDGLVIGPMTGAQNAFLNLAYNIYLIAHHADSDHDKLLSTILEKLKSTRSDDFIGKLFETYAAAAFLKAGFKLAYENEQDGATSHVEFVATYPKTGMKFSVEVKSRNRAPSGDGPVDDVKRLRVASKLNRALDKDAKHTRVVMIEVNVPDIVTSMELEGWPRAALSQIRHSENTPAPEGKEKPSAYVVVTNHAFHNNLDAANVGAQVLATGFLIPDFGPDIPFRRFKDALECEERHQEMFALLDSMRTHFEIPVTFDGEIPELAFNKKQPRLRFGQWYPVPGPDGKEIEGCLYEACVIENEKMIYGAYQGRDGKHFIASTPMTDEELIGWKRHPETFFGEVREIGGKVDNWIELAKFMYKTYHLTSREKLLEWMKDARDFDVLSNLSQKELAILYCERMAWSVDQKSRAKTL
jgi:hypothetical protein